MALKKYLNQKSIIIERALRKYLPKDSSLLSRAMRYSVLAGGKRLRPILVLLGAEVCGAKSTSDFLGAACAVEFIHAYSLIHDDLPAMDDDDLRRGKPTSHKKFGEAAAILAGDALLTDSFRLLAELSKNKRIKKENIISSISILSELAGYKGLVGGQAKDTIEAGNWNKKNIGRARQDLEYIHLNKTAALIRASLLIGAILANGSKKHLAAFDKYAKNVGLAFQVADDILDITGDKKLLGKKGSDRDNKKLTYPALYGINRSRETANKLVNSAKSSLKMFGKRAVVLTELADYIVERQY